jgi:hypothetical protein
MARRIIIEFSLLEESKERTNSEIINDILEAINDDAFVITWVAELLDIKILVKQLNGN